MTCMRREHAFKPLFPLDVFLPQFHADFFQAGEIISPIFINPHFQLLFSHGNSSEGKCSSENLKCGPEEKVDEEKV